MLSRVLLSASASPKAAASAVAWQNRGGQLVAQLNAAGEKQAAVAHRPAGRRRRPRSPRISPSARGCAPTASTSTAPRRSRSKKPTLEELTFLVEDPAAAKRAFQPLDKVAEAIFFTRDLVSEPANVIYPETLAEAARSLEKLGVEVEVLDEKQMKKLGMGALLGVGQGSVRPPRLVVMQWKGNPKAKNPAPLAFIGKGVTFDTGGISIKPAARHGGHEMGHGRRRRRDRPDAGARRPQGQGQRGRRRGAGREHARRARRSGRATSSRRCRARPIEVLNTDAEGRLVLADALWYCQDRFKPQLMVDLATLTGAIIVALGHEHAGLFCQQRRAGRAARRRRQGGRREAVAHAAGRGLRQADGQRRRRREEHRGGREAGSITAAQFLQRFVNNVPWAHLDIAGTTWSKKDAPTVPKGATAFGLRLLDRFVAEHYEGEP